MSKTTQQRLKRQESLIATNAVATTALSQPRNGRLAIRTTVATAQTFNLPAATGKGGKYSIYIGVTATGNKIVKANGTDLIQGAAVLASTGTSGSFSSAANTNTITLNGTTTGGVKGSLIELTDVAAGEWSVKVHGCGTGVAATCFSNT